MSLAKGTRHSLCGPIWRQRRHPFTFAFPLPLSPSLLLSSLFPVLCLLPAVAVRRHRSLLPRKLSAYLVLCSLRSTAYSCSLAAPLFATLAGRACRYTCIACQLVALSVIESIDCGTESEQISLLDSSYSEHTYNFINCGINDL